GSQSWSIYKQQLQNRFSSASYRDNFLGSIMDHLKVRTAYQKVESIPHISHRCPARKVLDKFTQTDSLILPVENDEKEIVGMISLYDVRTLLQQDIEGLIIATDVMVPARLLKLSDSFSTALKYLRESGEPELPVLRPGSGNTFIGVFSERDFLMAYEREMSKE